MIKILGTSARKHREMQSYRIFGSRKWRSSKNRRTEIIFGGRITRKYGIPTGRSTRGRQISQSEVRRCKSKTSSGRRWPWKDYRTGRRIRGESAGIGNSARVFSSSNFHSKVVKFLRTYFLGKKFFYAKFFYAKIFLRQNFFTPKFFMPEFLRQKIIRQYFFIPKFLYANIFSYPNFFTPKFLRKNYTMSTKVI
mgnify:CR=1 FL=1